MNPSTVDPPMQRGGLLFTLTNSLPGRVPLTRQFDIDAVRGIAILLVVVGHVVARDMPRDNHWYFVLKELIYKFHMPLFMVLTGISFALSLPKFATWESITAYSKQKVVRLVIPYLFFAVLILVGKLVATNFMHVDNPPRGSFDDVLALIVRPSSSAAGFLWFIYVLGLYFIALPAFLQATARRPIVLFVVSLAAQAISWPESFLLAEAFAYLPFFSAGMLLWMCRDRWAHISAFAATAYNVAFIVAVALALPLDISKWLIGGISVPAMLGLAQHLSNRLQHWLAWVGRHSLSIYLMNTLMIGIVKALMLKVMPWDGLNFLFYFLLLTLAGAALPIAVKQVTGHYFRRVDQYV